MQPRPATPTEGHVLVGEEEWRALTNLHFVVFKAHGQRCDLKVCAGTEDSPCILGLTLAAVEQARQR